MLKSQRHYYWIAGGLWLALTLAGALFLMLVAGEGEHGDGLLSVGIYPDGEIVTGSEALRRERGVVRRDVGYIDLSSRLQMTDPVSDGARPPLDLEIPAGRYRVAGYYPESDPRVLGSLAVRIAPGRVASWERVGRESSPLDFDISADEVFAVGDAEAIATLTEAAITQALAGSQAPVPFGQLATEMGDLLLFDPSFEALSSGIYAGRDAEGGLLVVVKDFGYFAATRALRERAGSNAAPAPEGE